MTEVVKDNSYVLTAAELAERLRVSERTLRNWRRLNKGPVWVKEGQTIRYPLDWLNKYMEAKGRKEIA